VCSFQSAAGIAKQSNMSVVYGPVNSKNCEI